MNKVSALGLRPAIPIIDLSDVPFLDQHAHPILRPEHVTPTTFQGAFTEGYAPEITDAQVLGTIAFSRGLREVAELLGCEPSLESVLQARSALPLEELTRRCFEAGGVTSVLLDDGLSPEQTQTIEWHRQYTAARRLLRVERLAEELIGTTRSWAQFVEAFHATLDTPPPDVVGLKSIVAYRSGLAVERVDGTAARLAFETLRARAAHGMPVRLVAKALNDWVLLMTLEAASRNSLPVQLHTGFGDPDLDLRLANPLHLRPLLENPTLRGVRMVLLHAAYPFTREAGFLASVYPQVYVDFGLAVPMLSASGMRFAVAALMELSPLSKIMASTDAHAIPELFYLGARWARRVLGEVLDEAMHGGDLTIAEAEAAAEGILRSNAERLYGLAT